MDEYLTPTQMAKKLKISRQAVIDRINRGAIKAIKVGRQYIIPHQELKEPYPQDAAKKHSKHDARIEHLLQLVKEKNIRTIQLWFVDILGILKCISITNGELADALAHGKGFDGSSVTGFAEAQESDIIAKPDPDTFTILPWTKEEKPNRPDVLRHLKSRRYALCR